MLLVQQELNMLCACEKVAVTLLAPGRRWSFTYGSASPLESMAFSPCGHKQTHKSTKTSCHIRCTHVSGVREVDRSYPYSDMQALVHMVV